MTSHVVFLVPGFAKDQLQTDVLSYFQHYLRTFIKRYPLVRISIISLLYPYEKYNYSWNGCEVYALGGKDNRYHRIITTTARTIGLIRQINKVHPISLVHSLWLKECAFIGSLAKRFLGIPHLSTAMGTEVLGNNKFKYLLNFNKLDLVFVSDFQRKTFEKHYKINKAEVIPFGIENIDIDFTNPRIYDVIGVGWFSDLKDHNSFIDVILELVKVKKDLKAIIVGGGENLKQLNEKIRKLNLQQNIQLLGQVSNELIMKLLSQSKVLLHTSKFESQGFVFLEALINGMSIVSRNVGIAENSDRWKITNDINEMKKAILDFLKEEFPKSSIRMIKAEDTADAYHDLYEKLIKNEY